MSADLLARYCLPFFLLLSLTACASSPKEDSFSGAYVWGQKPDPVVVSAMKNGLWRIETDGSVKTLVGNSFWHEIDSNEIRKLMSDDTDIKEFRCLTPQTQGMYFCQLPVGSSFLFREMLGSPSHAKSKTGFFMVGGSVAGLLVFELKKVK